MTALFRHLVEYRVSDLRAELAFWRDGAGFVVAIQEPDYAILGRPGGDFRLALRLRPSEPTPPGAFSVQLWCESLPGEAALMAARGLVPYEAVHPYDAGPDRAGLGLETCAYRTPAGIALRFWAPMASVKTGDFP
jgi:hypothetical protein